MRLGGPLFEEYGNPEEWVELLHDRGYAAAYCPLEPGAPAELIEGYAAAAREGDVVIAEVGAWSNPISPDPETRAAAVEKCKESLALAEAIGARCCVNIAGSRGEIWHGPCAEDLTEETFEMIVTSVREIVDEVRPERTFYTLETMPRMYPDSVDSYVALVEAIDRGSFGVHFDPVNLICSPQRCFRNAGIIRDFVARLGPHIQSCHAKDIQLREQLTVHLDEVRPGRGELDYRTYLSELAGLGVDVPIMMEHLPDAGEYAAAADHLRSVAREVGTSFD